ncbi:hypothetical protein SLS53_007972 [Cytospora paraplurivora]|uniref:Uncharacterized protein n=1 Tax=Cytospora paraplurivora TaxID=2898453 RepID=A0AAN9YBZ3_9PEZI
MAEYEYPVTDLVVVNYNKLQQKDAVEAANMYSACVEQGFFYLDLGDSKSDVILQTVNELFEVTKDYKPLGLDHGNVENQKDGCEGLRVGY